MDERLGQLLRDLGLTPTQVFTFVGLALLTGTLFKLGKHLDESASKEATKSTSALLKTFQPGTYLSRMAATFVHAFDSIFGQKHLTWYCFGKSLIASTLAGIGVFWVVKLITDTESSRMGGNIFVIGLGLTIVTGVPDYLSLLKTRRI